MSAIQLGDIIEDDTIDFTFNTHQTDGTPIVLGGTPALSVYKANGTTETTTGITLSVSFDTRVGLNHVRIDLTDAFYTADEDYSVVVTTGTVDGVSVVGTTVAQFSIKKKVLSVLGVAGAGLTDIGGMSTAMKAEVQTEANDALVANNLDHLLKVAMVAGDVTDNSVIAKLVSKAITASWTTYNNADDSLEGNRDNVGEQGNNLADMPWNAAWDAEVQSEVDDALVARGLQQLVNTALSTSLIADQSVIAQLMSSIGEATTFDKSTDSLEAIRNNADTTATDVSAILVDTNELQTDWVDGGRLDLLVDAIKASTDVLPIKKGVAVANFYFVMFDSDGSAATGIAGTITAQVSKDGAAYTSVAGAISEVGSGVYKVPLAGSETNFTDGMFIFTSGAAQTTYKEVITESV